MAVLGNEFVDNNHVGVTSLLYNFFEATDLTLGKNFQGTILAPYAHTHDGADGHGHLSGALITKSFKGATESATDHLQVLFRFLVQLQAMHWL